MFRSHVRPQPHLHPAWNLLRSDCSPRPGASSVQTQDSGAAHFPQLYRKLWTISVFIPNVVVSPPPPVGRLLCCSGIHLHGHEFVIHHHWLGDRRVPKRRRTLGGPAEQKYSKQNANQSFPLLNPPPILPSTQPEPNRNVWLHKTKDVWRTFACNVNKKKVLTCDGTKQKRL